MFNRKIVRAPVVAATNLTKGILLKPQIGTIEDDNEDEYTVFTGAYEPWSPTTIVVEEEDVDIVQTTDPEPIAVLWQDLTQSQTPVTAYVLVEGIVFEDELAADIPEAAKILLRKSNIIVMPREIV